MPWDAVLSTVEKLLHWFSPRFMLFIFLLSSALFFMPLTWASYFALNDWIILHRAWLGGAMLVSAVYLLPFGVSPMVEKQVAAIRSAGRMALTMGNLAEDEKRLLRRFYFPRQVGRLIVWRHEIGKLESDGVVFRPGDSGLGNEQEVFCLTPAALKYVAKHRETFLKEPEETNPSLY